MNICLTNLIKIQPTLSQLTAGIGHERFNTKYKQSCHTSNHNKNKNKNEYKINSPIH